MAGVLAKERGAFWCKYNATLVNLLNLPQDPSKCYMFKGWAGYDNRLRPSRRTPLPRATTKPRQAGAIDMPKVEADNAIHESGVSIWGGGGARSGHSWSRKYKLGHCRHCPIENRKERQEWQGETSWQCKLPAPERETMSFVVYHVYQERWKDDC